MPRLNQSPKQLKAGMPVVVFIKPEYVLVGDEERNKLVKGVWIKGNIWGDVVQAGITFVEVNGCVFSTVVSGLIIIRSTSQKDNRKPYELKRAASYQYKRISKQAVK